MSKKTSKKKESKKVELEEIRGTVFELGGLIDKSACLTRVLRYLGKALLSPSCPYSCKMNAVIDLLQVELDTAEDMSIGFIETHWDIERKQLRDELIRASSIG